MSLSNLHQHDELVRSCIDSVRSKIMTTFDSIGQRDTDISLIQSTVKAHTIPARIKIVLKPIPLYSTTAGAFLPKGAYEASSEQEAQSLLNDHMVASRDHHRIAWDYIRKTFDGDGLAVGSRETPLPESCLRYSVANTYHCPGCRGNARVQCPVCGGQGIVTCSGCNGDGTQTTTYTVPGTGPAMIAGSATDHVGNASASTNPVPDEVRTTISTCGGCSGSGEVRCHECGGDGAVGCGSCQATGRITACRSITYEIVTTLEWSLSENPEDLRDWLQAQDPDELPQLHADAELVADKGPSASCYAMRYNVKVPFGTITFRFGGDAKDLMFVVSGKTGDVIQAPPFLEATLPTFRNLRGESLAISCAEALAALTIAVQHPVVRIVSTHALAEPSAGREEIARGVRRAIPVGLTHQRICELIDAARCHTHRAFDRRRMNTRIAQYALLSLVLFGAYFALPIRVQLDYRIPTLVTHIIDIGVIATALLCISAISVRMTRLEVYKIFSPVFRLGARGSSHWEGLNRYFAPSRRTLFLVRGEVIVLFLLTAALVAFLGRSAPMWVAWMFTR